MSKTTVEIPSLRSTQVALAADWRQTLLPRWLWGVRGPRFGQKQDKKLWTRFSGTSLEVSPSDAVPEETGSGPDNRCDLWFPALGAALPRLVAQPFQVCTSLCTSWFKLCAVWDPSSAFSFPIYLDSKYLEQKIALWNILSYMGPSDRLFVLVQSEIINSCRWVIRY